MIANTPVNKLKVPKENKINDFPESRNDSEGSTKRNEHGRDINILAEVRKLMGLFPIKPRHILNFNEDYSTISVDNISHDEQAMDV